MDASLNARIGLRTAREEAESIGEPRAGGGRYRRPAEIIAEYGKRVTARKPATTPVHPGTTPE